MTSIQKISLVLLTGLFCCKGKDKAVANTPDRLFDKLRLTDLENKPIYRKQNEGKTIFVNFWATWCKPCREEMPSIERAQHILRNENIVFLMASSETAEEIKEYETNHKYKFRYAQIENSEELGIQALPTTFIFDAGGTLVFSETGSRKWDETGSIDMIKKIIHKND